METISVPLEMFLGWQRAFNCAGMGAEWHEMQKVLDGHAQRPAAPASPVQALPGQLPPSVALLPPSTSYTPAQALQASMHHAEHMEQLLVIGQYHPEPGTDKQVFFCIGSRLDLGKALWLHRRLGLYIDENA